MNYFQLASADRGNDGDFVARRFTRNLSFPQRGTVPEIEEGRRLMPKFGEDGLVPCITQDADSGEVLMLGYMNREALSLTISSAYAHYWSRSRRQIWAKGERSGQSQQVEQILVDDDQDCLLLKVRLTGGAACHVGYRSCFYRRLFVSEGNTDFSLRFVEHEKIYDPAQAYGGQQSE